MQPLNTALLNIAALLNTARSKKAVLCAAYCLIAVSLPRTIFAQDGAPPQQIPLPAHGQPAPAATSTASEVALSALPDSPGAAWTKGQNGTPEQDTSPAAASTQTATSQAGTSQDAAPQDRTSQNTATQDQSQKPQRPVGTAAAEAPKVNGVTAAQPAGVAIAPAKLRRVRTIVIRVGAIVGAGVAVGTVIALTAGTSSKPPGAR